MAVSHSVDWPIALLLVLLSPAVGSFLGVLVERLPKGRSIIQPSACAQCDTRLPWAHMIPVFSALALRYKCAFCGAAIPGHLIRIEVAAIFVTIAALFISLNTAHFVAVTFCFWCLVVLFYSDLYSLRLPDPLTLALFVGSVGVAWADPARTITAAVLTGLAASLVFEVIRRAYAALRHRDGMGFGDVKLVAGLGALLGWQVLPWAVMLAAVLALATAALDALAKRLRPRGSDVLPFGSYLCGATLLVMLL